MTRLPIALPFMAACLSCAAPPHTTAPIGPDELTEWKPYQGPAPVDWLLKPKQVAYKNVPGEIWNVALTSDFPAKSVSMHWTHRPTGELISQVFSVPYWVSAVALGHDGLNFAVAGKRPSGHTVIDQFRTSEPSPPESAHPHAQHVTAWTIYDEAQEGRDIVCALAYTPINTNDKLVAQFYDSRSLYTLDVADPLKVEYELLASSKATSDQPPRFHIPPLAKRPFFHVDTMKHVSRGTIFIFKSFIKSTATIVAIDETGDGDITAVEALTSAEWASSDLSRGEMYHDW